MTRIASTLLWVFNKDWQPFKFFAGFICFLKSLRRDFILSLRKVATSGKNPFAMVSNGQKQAGNFLSNIIPNSFVEN